MNDRNIFAQFDAAYMIAEIGVNHNGDMSLAKSMIREAKLAGANAVKFQTFTANSLALPSTPKVSYQQQTVSTDESHFEMLQKLELNKEDHYVLAGYCKEVGVDFISTPYDIESAKFLSKVGVKYFKTASADIVDLPLHRYIASTKLPTIVATGMASLGEIEQVVNIYREANSCNLILLHAVSNYPCSDESLNMRVMGTLAHAFDVPIGFSDHSVGYLAAVIAATYGAKVVEKHFTLDQSLPGPDHKASSTPVQFQELVSNVRRVEIMLGSSQKVCQVEEKQMSQVSRKSVVLAETLTAGTILAAHHIVLKRPGSGIEPIFLPKIIGQALRTNLPSGHQIRWTDFVAPQDA